MKKKIYGESFQLPSDKAKRVYKIHGRISYLNCGLESIQKVTEQSAKRSPTRPERFSDERDNLKTTNCNVDK